MNITKTSIPEVIIIEPRIFSDDRGYFFESFNRQQFENVIGYSVDFVQDNHSKSIHNVLRGLHFQRSPNEQGKLVRCISGEVFDVAVDIRKSSPTFGKWVGVLLSAENNRQLWIPEGFAHGFIVLSDQAEFLYKTTSYYDPKLESSILWSDPDLNIAWPSEKPILSEKDKNAQSWNEFIHSI
ncbi:dTDP-4-dehydrorhamnose 3,5-epimerase [Aeromonas veronii]|uniref:dTDP-4-dehydrorhamnose 3,5-epimerase n=1 Tax=Aeromonas veronii TaxID=654 RepID=UPI00211D51FE|nr:dTDP-4-dehydrorhamnose 3,5-epimerase [Aeromonas veronii]UUM70154.1 dTDP-4-dehydrorhamnose 3,5-epimerase [Aeromonas veronii]